MEIDNLILEKLNWRYAAKMFDESKKVNNQTLDTILKSANLTATSFGLQAYKILVSDKVEIKEKLYKATFRQNQIQTCSHNIILCIKTNVDANYIDKYINLMAEKRNEPIEKFLSFRNNCIHFLAAMSPETKLKWLKHQVYIVLGNILNTCALLNVDSCPIEGFNNIEVDDILGLRKMDLQSVVMCPIGYRAENDFLSKIKKVRFPMSETIINI